MPNKTHIIQIRTTDNQFNRIKNNAQSKGFTSVSAYLRDISLKNSLVLEQQVADMHNLLCGKEPKEREQHKSKPMELQDYVIPDGYNQPPPYGEI